MSPLQCMRSLLALVLIPPMTFVVCVLAIIDLKVGRRSKPKAQVFPRYWGRIICAIVGAKVRVEGVEHLDPEQTYIFVGNHCSQFDIYAFQGYFPHDFRWIAKKELFRIPLFGWVMRETDYIPIDRSHGRRALKSLNEAAQRIREGISVLIFPEGTRSPDGTLQPFKSGAIMLAIKAGVPVVPLGFNGTHQVLPKGKLLARAGEIVIRVGRPIPTAEYKMRDKQALAAQLHDRVAELLDPAHLPAGF